MINIEKITNTKHRILCIGSYPAIIQSILDFDFISGKREPSVFGIIAAGRKFERYFFGKREIMIPVFESVKQIPKEKKSDTTLFLNLVSGRRVLTTTVEVIEDLPSLAGGVIFAEGTPEKHAIDLRALAEAKKIFLLGPASVGLLIPKNLKLGAIGGVTHKQLLDAQLFEKGNIAVFSASGGTTNELINIVTSNNKRISFALHFGGERFPATTPREAFLAAESDSNTEYIVYFGELGGTDEYEICELRQTGKLKKPTFCYIAGTVAEIFPSSPQFGHAKAMAQNKRETARAKRDALKEAGVNVAESFGEFIEMIREIPSEDKAKREKRKGKGEKIEKNESIIGNMNDRSHALIATSISKDEDGKPTVLGEDLLDFAKQHSFAYITASLFLGKKIKSRELEEFVDFVLKLLVDHGPYVSGAVNTIVASRAGRDLVSSLASGLLTIGPRFGGAINQAASKWIEGVTSGKSPSAFVEDFATRKKYISGIGHRKYRVDLPDPRVREILYYVKDLRAEFTNFAKEVEKITVAKKGNLILNVDGAIASVLLDILSEKEGYSADDLRQLCDMEFFNALFVASRSIGFIAHALDQKRLDEGIFRLEEEHVVDASEK